MVAVKGTAAEWIAKPVQPFGAARFATLLGLSWMFAHSVGLRVEAGYPGIKVGLLFAL